MRPGPGDVIDRYDLALVWSACAIASLVIYGCGDHREVKPQNVMMSTATDAEPAPPSVPHATLYWQTGSAADDDVEWSLSAEPDPRWADVEADRLDAIQLQWIPEDTRGPPPGWTVEVVEGDGFDLGGLRVFGHASLSMRHIRVSRWAALVPGGRRHGGEFAALSHELSHAWVYAASRDEALASRAGHR